MLVDEHGEDAAALDEVDRADVALFAVEGLQSESPPVPVDQSVEVFVALRLEDGADFDVAHPPDELRVKFPIADVIDGHDHALAPVERAAQMVEAVHFHPRLHGVLGHFGQTGDAE